MSTTQPATLALRALCAATVAAAWIAGPAAAQEEAAAAEAGARPTASSAPGTDPPVSEAPLYRDVTRSHLPAGELEGLSMDAGIADLDGDGDPDVLIANEHRPNILLLNDGEGRFTIASDRIPQISHDSEDVGFGDFDGDGHLDAIVVSEDDRRNELYLNEGDGSFRDASGRLPVTGTSNAVAVADLTGDGAPDVLIGNNGQNVFLENDGEGGFTDATGERLPVILDVTQDVELGDADGDGDPDLLVGNEDDNRLLINDGTGRFEDQSADRTPYREGREETREADFGDVDGDGDLDVLFANVQAFVEDADPSNRLLINDGTGHFADETEGRLPEDDDRSFDGDLLDVDRDGDLDVVTSNTDFDLEAERIAPLPYRVYLNDGEGRFRLATEEVFPEGVTGMGFDVEGADLDGDGLMDLYLAGRGTVDRLLLGVEQQGDDGAEGIDR